MESKTKNIKTRPQIAAMAARAFGGMALADGEGAVVELKDGWFNAAYSVRLADGREVILKIAPPRDAEVMLYEKNIMTTEVAAMRLVRRNPAIPVPQIYHFDDTRELCDSDYFFMEKIAADNLEHVRANLPPETQASIDLHIGEIVREINGFTGTYFGYDGNPDLRASTWREAFTRIMESVLEDGARKGVAYDQGYDEIRAAVLRHAPALEEVTTPCLVHWDVWNPNVFVKEGRVAGIIDFERALWADPLMEAQFRLLSAEGITSCMRGYGKTSFTFEEERRCRLYSLHLALVMNTECYYRNYDTDSVLNLSRQWMGEHMAWLSAN
ncbi:MULTISPECIES: phosphotransferase family protein [Sorangium]|uniref:Probable Aminoglycoside phosphotransferase n=1 Tax=Sorangium cellulosum (strain So ce56) TaxID=448385 RepID=A9FXX2_SORC5|nr:aminoglycoside phosphotransferase family protein [Sorangium cellulosum]CAN95558.1 Probable Aminoglycoside phosphotransferase [Sorangium cellulosum So ce56]